MKINRNLSITIVCVLLGITLAWQYQSIRSNQKVATLQSKREDELIVELLREKENVENLRKKYEELYTEYKKYENTIGGINEKTKLIQDQLEKNRMIAGLTAVKGKGVIVTFSKDDADGGLIRDDDILNILNELRASDAQAIAINDERIVATSEVRVAGGYIVVNGRQTLAPFVIRAVADPVNVENAFNMMNGVVETLRNVWHINVVIEKSDNVLIPRVREEVIKTDMLTPVENK